MNHILQSLTHEWNYSKHTKRTSVRVFSVEPLWSVTQLKGFILYVQKTYQPKLSLEAQKILSCYYRYVRSHNCSGTQATVRLLESLIRLAQAHARLMMRPVVLTMVGLR